MPEVVNAGPRQPFSPHTRGQHGLVKGVGEVAVDDWRAGERHEQPSRSRPRAVTARPVGGERIDGGCRHDHVAALAELGVADFQDGLVPVDIATVEPKGFADPHAGDGQQHGQAGRRLCPEGEPRRGLRGAHHSGHVLVGEQVRAAQASTPFAFRAETLTSLTVLLAVTGMRVGEALRLDCCDVDWDQAVLKVRDTKFGKGRDVVVSASTVDALATYRSRRDSTRPATARLFVSLAGTPVIYSNFAHTFHQAVLTAGVGAEGLTRPRVHDLRHAFAVRTLLGWYRAGLDVEALLPRLSTYLGHQEPRFTYQYLTATPELLGYAAARLDATQDVAQ